MKAEVMWASLAILLASAPALPKEAMPRDTKTCEASSAGMTPAEHTANMKRCLAQRADPSSVNERQQQEKRARCEQNAKNQKLQGSVEANFVSSCMSKNEAAEAAKAASAPAQAQAAAPAKTKKASAHETAGKKGNSCLKQAKQKGLMGEERKKYLKDCAAN